MGIELFELRRRLAWDGFELGDYFHATTDKQAVRDEVFASIMKHPFTVQATIMEKCKAQPQVSKSKPRFYQYGYFYHFKYGATKQLPHDCEALVTTASLGTRKERAAFRDAVDDVMRQTKRTRTARGRSKGTGKAIAKTTDPIPSSRIASLTNTNSFEWGSRNTIEG